MMSASVMEYTELVAKIVEPRSAKQQLDFLFTLSTELAYKNTCVSYFAPELTSRIIQYISNTNNTIEDACIANELNEIERIDYELMAQDAVERIQDAVLPHMSFFCTWINGEYYSVNVDEDGELVEDYKYDQKTEDKKKFATLMEWINEYKLTIDKIEIGVPIDTYDDDIYGTN